MNYSNDLLKLAQNYNLSAAEVVLCFALAAGAPPVDAYRIILRVPSTVSNDQAEQRLRTLKASSPAVPVLINRIKNGTGNRTAKEELQRAKEQTKEERRREEEQLRTRAGIVSKIITTLSDVDGKDAISGLQTLAKLQGFDKPDEKTDEERRTYFLPFVSRCRSCALFRLFADSQ